MSVIYKDGTYYGMGDDTPAELTSSQMDDIKSAFHPATAVVPQGIIFDERGTEYVVGTYIGSDGKKKPIYQKTFDAGSNITVISTGWTSTSFQASSDVGKILQAVGTNGDACCPLLALNDYSSTGVWRFEASRNEASINLRWFTVRYTKTTDTPV